MLHALLADLVLLFHLAFVLFVVAGALLVWRFPRVAWLHVPAVLWAGFVELSGRICPLTPLENHLRRLGGESGYAGDFVEHYLLPLLYPHELAREFQIGLGIAVVATNLAAYALLIRRGKR